MILKSLKLEVDNAENAQIAVDMVKDNDYDLILMDIQMPVMDGIEATKIIRDDLKKETPIVAVTAMSVGNKETFLLNNKLNDYIAKPVNK
jgi:CheY-like chemotaxis protein